MHVRLITKPGMAVTGTSRYVSELHKGLTAAGIDCHLQAPGKFPPDVLARPVRRLGLDVQAFFGSYPVRAQLDPADIYHIPTQTMATLLHFQRFPGPVIVTVLDIIPYLVRHDPNLNTFRHGVDAAFYRIALNALRRADAIIAISEYTRQTLIDTLRLPPERIHVTHLGVDHTRFRPMDVPDTFRAKYQLDRDHQYVLYVGSEDPRKNLQNLIRAFAQLQHDMGAVKLLKVGPAHFADERAHLLALIHELGIDQHVRFFNHVSDEDLPLFYNVADVLVLPALYEGFGFPAIEAMACSKPVVVSNRTSLPELVRDPQAQVDPEDIDALSHAIQTQMNSNHHERWREQAARFTWEATVQKTLAVYSAVLEAE